MKTQTQKTRLLCMKPYSLIELLAAMTVFSLLMLSLMQFLSSAQKIWTGSNAKTQMFEDARIALNLISRDLQEIFYSDSAGGFSVPAATPIQQMALSTRVDGKPNGSCNSNIAIVKWYYDSTNNVLSRLVKGDSGPTSDPTFKYTAPIYSEIDAEQTGTDSTHMHQVIERVVDFELEAYEKNMTTSFTSGSRKVPYLVKFSISLLDQNSYEKWKSTGSTDVNHILVKNNKRTFTKYVFIGNRGQEN